MKPIAASQLEWLRSFVHTYRCASLWAVGHSDQLAHELVQHTYSNSFSAVYSRRATGDCSSFWASIMTMRLGSGVATSKCGAPRDRSRAGGGAVLRPLREWNQLMFAAIALW